jgi:hypothetical protein
MSNPKYGASLALVWVVGTLTEVEAVYVNV